METLFPGRLCDRALLGVSLNLKLSVYEVRNSLATYYFVLVNLFSSEDLRVVYKHECSRKTPLQGLSYHTRRTSVIRNRACPGLHRRGRFLTVWGISLKEHPGITFGYQGKPLLLHMEVQQDPTVSGGHTLEQRTFLLLITPKGTVNLFGSLLQRKTNSLENTPKGKLLATRGVREQGAGPGAPLASPCEAGC